MRFLLVCLFWLLGKVALVSGDEVPKEVGEQGLVAIVKEFQGRLGISEQVAVSIVEAEKYLVSVQRSPGPGKGFIIRLEKEFLATLTDEELCSVLAHELGHVWIFTNHPYLHTEALANQKAMQLVSGESLEKVYEKVWKQTGHKGTLQDFLARVE